MSHSFRDDPRFLITLLPALEVSRMQALDNAMELERQIQEIKEALSSPPAARNLPQSPSSPLQLGAVNGYTQPPVNLPAPPPPPPPPSAAPGDGPAPDTQAGFVLAEARQHGGRIDTQAIVLAATRSNNPMIKKLLKTNGRGSAINNLVQRGFAVRGPDRGSIVLTPKGLGKGPENQADKQARPWQPPMPNNLRRALAKVAGDAEATAATKKSTRGYPKGLPPKPDTQYGFILAEARRHGGTVNTAQLIEAAKRGNRLIRKIASPAPISVARSSLINRGFLVKAAGAPGSGTVKLTPQGMEATNYVTDWGTAKGRPVKHTGKSVQGIRHPDMTQSQYLAKLAIEHGTINNDQIREVAVREKIYPNLAKSPNLSVAIALAIKGGYVTRTGPGVLEATKR